jgi:hypothetical protein
VEDSKDKLAFPAKVDQDYFKGGCGALMLNIEFSSVYNLITLVRIMCGLRTGGWSLPCVMSD